MRMLCLCRLALCVLFPFTSADVLAEEFKFKRPSTTVQLPEFGVSIDAEGVLDLKVTRDPGGALFAQRIAAARAKLPPDIQRPTNLRKISLSRLDQALGRQAANGQRAEEAMQNLAGLLQIEYVFCYPDSNDIVIAGPAEGWVPDGIGRNVGITSGRPTLRLDDLAVALRQYPPGQRNQQFIGCTISPTKTGLEALAEFQKTIPRTVSSRQRGAVAAYTAKGMRDALGLADIRTWGVPPESNFAQVMVEAD